MINRFARRIGKSERGAAILEFAIVALLLLTILFAIIEFSWIFFGWNTLTGAVREGARLAIVGEDDIQEKVEKHASSFHIKKFGISMEDSGKMRTVIVSATGELPLLIGFFPISNPYEISAEARMRYESGEVNEININYGKNNGNNND